MHESSGLKRVLSSSRSPSRPNGKWGVEVDEAELQAVAGGANRYEKLNEYCSDAGEFMCGLGLGVAL